MLRKNKLFLPLDIQYFAEETAQAEEQSTENAEEQDQTSQEDQGEEKEDKQEPEKVFTKEQFEAEMKRRVAAEKKRAEEKVKEAEKLAKMNEEQKREYEFEKMQQELEELRKKDAYYELSKEASKMLTEQNITADDELLSLVVKDSAEETQAAVNSFVSIVNTKVEEGVKKALAGKSPKINAKPGQVTKKDIMAIQDPEERLKAIQEHQHLFKSKFN